MAVVLVFAVQEGVMLPLESASCPRMEVSTGCCSLPKKHKQWGPTTGQQLERPPCEVRRSWRDL